MESKSALDISGDRVDTRRERHTKGEAKRNSKLIKHMAIGPNRKT